MEWTCNEKRLIDQAARNIELYKKWNQIYSWTVESAEKTYLNSTSMAEKYSDGPLNALYKQRTKRFTLKQMYHDIPGFWDFAETLTVEQFRLCKEYYLMHTERIRSLENPLKHLKELIENNQIRDEIYNGIFKIL